MKTSTPTTPSPVLNRRDFIGVSLALILPSQVRGIALYLSDPGSDNLYLYRGAEFPIGSDDLENLAKSGHAKLYVHCNDHGKFQKFLRENLDENLTDESLSVTQRYSMLNMVMHDILSDVFKEKDIDAAISQADALGKKTVDLLDREEVVTSQLFGILRHDYHTFAHSTNVACYCVMLAKRLGITGREDLDRIATGALLHDLGKLGVPEAILTKPGKLDDRELSVIQRHPTIGFRNLCERDDMNYGQLMMVYQHHERLDGGGYPVRVGADEIHPWAKICTVADIFEALTANRPYRAGSTASEAFAIMQRQLDTAIDRSIFECWTTIIEPR